MHISVIAIDMLKDGWDVNEEYEKLFGSAKRINLFNTEEEYRELRQFVIEQPQETLVSDLLPFDGIDYVAKEKQPKLKRDCKKDFSIKQELSQLINSLTEYINLKISEIVLSLSKGDYLRPTPKKVEIKQEFVKSPRSGRPPLYYYISRDLGDKSCKAKGIYDKVNDKFIIMAGSVLSRNVSSSYRFTASEIKRTKFIQLNCERKGELILKRDSICNSPDEAACFVLGEIVNGWEEWKSKNGKPLGSYINKT